MIRTLILAGFLLFSSVVSFSAERCENLFVSKSEQKTSKVSEKVVENLRLFMSRFKPQDMSAEMARSLYESVKNLLADTTGKRVENKVSADTDDVNQSMSQFKTELNEKGLELVDRDKQVVGKRNVTYTEYTRPFSVSIQLLKQMGFEIRPDYLLSPDKKVTVKIRIRSYGTVDSQKTKFGIEDIEFAPFTKERAFVELKFEDPSFEGAVFKPQMYFNKKFLSIMGKSEFLNNFENIKSETLAHLKISDKKTLDQTSVMAMLEFLRLAHVHEFDLRIVAINLYERVAKSVSLNYQSQNDPEFNTQFGTISKVELQMTFDRMISLWVPGNEYSAGEKKYYYSYGPNQTVSEFKTPTFLAHHLKKAQAAAKAIGREGFLVTEAHAEQLDQIAPGLKNYIQMIDRIVQVRDESKQLNRGKWGVAIKQIQSDLYKFLIGFFKEDTILH